MVHLSYNKEKINDGLFSITQFLFDFIISLDFYQNRLTNYQLHKGDFFKLMGISFKHFMDKKLYKNRSIILNFDLIQKDFSDVTSIKKPFSFQISLRINTHYYYYDAYCTNISDCSSKNSECRTLLLTIKSSITNSSFRFLDSLNTENIDNGPLKEIIYKQYELSKKFSFPSTFEETLETTAESIMELKDIDFCSIYVPDKTINKDLNFILKVHKGKLKEFFEEIKTIISAKRKWSMIDFSKAYYFDSDTVSTSNPDNIITDSQASSFFINPCIYNKSCLALILSGSLRSKKVSSYLRHTLESISFQTARVISFIRAKESQIESTERYKILSEIASDFAYSYTIDSEQNHSIEWLSEAFTRITGFEKYEYGNLIKWEHIVYPDDIDYYNHLYTKRLQGIFITGEYRIYTKDMKIKTIRDIAYPQFDPIKNTVTRIIGAVQDITEQKNTERQLIKAAKERKTLLQEIHHRVKNNLQIISSLLDFQANSSDNLKLRKLLQESQNRVLSMSFVHEQLYRSHSLAEINMLDYITSLSSHLSNIYNLQPVRLTLDIEDISFTVDQAIPCGLMINELLTNSYTHAFPSDTFDPHKENTIRVRLSLESNNFILQVSDNGRGFNFSDKIKKNNSLGLKLISMLVTQLEGNFNFYFDDGTKCTVKFPLYNE